VQLHSFRPNARYSQAEDEPPARPEPSVFTRICSPGRARCSTTPLKPPPPPPPPEEEEGAEMSHDRSRGVFFRGRLSALLSLLFRPSIYLRGECCLSPLTTCHVNEKSHPQARGRRAAGRFHSSSCASLTTLSFGLSRRSSEMSLPSDGPVEVRRRRRSFAIPPSPPGQREGDDT